LYSNLTTPGSTQPSLFVLSILIIVFSNGAGVEEIAKKHFQFLLLYSVRFTGRIGEDGVANLSILIIVFSSLRDWYACCTCVLSILIIVFPPAGHPAGETKGYLYFQFLLLYSRYCIL